MGVCNIRAGHEIRREIAELSKDIFELCKVRDSGRLFTFAESCTGGLAAFCVTSVPGISEYFPGSAVTYGNRAKIELLGVAPETIDTHGAVSGQCAAEMACGALRLFGAEYAVSITGIAGPGGGSAEKPVGTVWFAIAGVNGVLALKKGFYPHRGRRLVRLFAARSALSMLKRHMISLIG